MTTSVHADSPYTLDLRVDLPVIALSGSIALAGFFDSGLPACAPNCSPARLNVIDRSAIHFRSNTSGAIADVALPLVLLAPVVLDYFDSGVAADWLKDALVMVESLAVDQTFTQLTKFAVRRNSPALYSGDSHLTALHDTDAARSFISAHTSSACAVTTAFAVTYWLRHPDDPLRYLVLGAGIGLSLAVGILKVLAGAHFWSDVGAGALVGGSVGVLVPMAHIKF
ncbi:MAG TPA: phosphatase PAP2 family protein [Polyangiales bacterium]|nr:phosphatase PAP2 family protein [Polyangiales bacterium]